jgi:hypothetical protein
VPAYQEVNMKKTAAAAALLAAGLSLGLAPIASATEQEYITDLESAGFSGQTDTAITMGYEVCTDIKNGVSEAATIDAIYENTGNGVERSDAKYIYEAAALYLCG